MTALGFTAGLCRSHPRAELCIYGPTLFLQEQWDGLIPGHVCTDVAGYVSDLDLDPDQGSWVSDYLGYLCSPVSKTQAWPGVNVVSHVLDLGDPAPGNELAGIIRACATAFMAPGDYRGSESVLRGARVGEHMPRGRNALRW